MALGEVDARVLAEWLNRWEGDPRWSGFQVSTEAAQFIVSALSQHMELGEELRDADFTNRSTRTSRGWVEYVSVVAVTNERLWLVHFETGQPVRVHEVPFGTPIKSRHGRGAPRFEAGILEIGSRMRGDVGSWLVGPPPRSTWLGPVVASGGQGWYPDPLGRHQFRWWSATAWTRHVADNGVQADDPLPTT